MRVIPGVFLDRLWRAAVGVALAKNRIDGASLDLVVAGLDLFLLFALCFVRVVGDLVALSLQFGDGGLQLRHRGADVRELDDIGLRARGQISQLRQSISDSLTLGEKFWKVRDDASGQGDISGLDCDAGVPGEGLDDGKQGVGC